MAYADFPGGLEYVQPGRDTFPLVQEFDRIVATCDVLLSAGWQDGSSESERSMEGLLERQTSKESGGPNIIPEYARAKA